MQIIRKSYSKFRTINILKYGMGPMSSKMLNSFVKNRCMNCYTRIGDQALFENALVVKKNDIRVMCIGCRSNNEVKLKDYYDTYDGVDKYSVIYDLEKRIKKSKSIDWYHIVLSWRENNIYFCDHYLEYDKVYSNVYYQETYLDSLTGKEKNILTVDFFDRKAKTIQSKFGDKMSIGNCGECGAGIGVRVNSETNCLNCGIPDELQWNLRITYKGEKELLNS